MPFVYVCCLIWLEYPLDQHNEETQARVQSCCEVVIYVIYVI